MCCVWVLSVVSQGGQVVNGHAGVMSLHGQAWVKLWKALNGSLKSLGFV